MKFEIFIIFFVVWNIIVFSMYGIDKRKSKLNKWRISEKTLIISAIFMGGLGAYLGMKTFHHKTKHMKFKIGIPLSLVINIAVFCLCLYKTI